MKWLRWIRPLAALGVIAAGVLTAQAEPGDLPVPRESSSERYWLNIRVRAIPQALDAQLDLRGAGVLVEQVGEEGPAAKAGIKANDVLLALGDKPITKPADLESAVAEGKELSLKLLRGG